MRPSIMSIPTRRSSRLSTHRSDLKALAEQLKSAEKARSAAKAERYPTISFSGDYGDIGVNPANSHGTGDATGTTFRSHP